MNDNLVFRQDTAIWAEMHLENEFLLTRRVRNIIEMFVNWVPNDIFWLGITHVYVFVLWPSSKCDFDRWYSWLYITAINRVKVFNDVTIAY